MNRIVPSCLIVLLFGAITRPVSAEDAAPGAVADEASKQENVAAAPSSGVLMLRNGSSVAGRLESSDSGDMVRWQGDAFTRPFEFPTGEISSLTYPPADPRVDMKGEFALELVGGDLLSGRIVGWTDGQLALESPLFGEIRLQEKAVRRLYRIDDNPGLLLSGLTGLSDWGAVKGKWHSDGTQLWSDQPDASLTGDFDLPEKAVVEFELSWKKTPNFRFAIGVDPRGKNDASGGWSFETWGSTLALVRERPDIAAVEQIQSLDASVSRLRLIAFLDQGARTIHVYLPDGGPVTKMTLPAPEKPLAAGASAAKQTGITLVNHAGLVRLERLRIARWNGTLPLGEDSATSRFELKGGEIVTGKVTGFERSSGTISVRSEGETKEIGMADVNAAEFVGSGIPKSLPLTAALHDQTRLSGELVRVTDRSVVIRNPDIDRPIELARGAIHSIAMSGGSRENASAALTALSGRMEVGGLRLQGRLIPGTATEDASCLVWHPEFSVTASPLKPSASGRIVYRERRPPAPKTRRQVQRQQQPKNVFEKFGDLFLKNLSKSGGGKKPIEGEPHDVHLLTGDVVPCRIESIDQFGVRIKSTTAEVDMIPHSKIKAVVLDRFAAPPELEKAKKERLLTLPRNQKSSPPTQLLCARTGDFLRCRLDSLTGDRLTIEVQLTGIELPLERITHIIWLHPELIPKSETEDAAEKPDGEQGEPPLVAERPDLRPHLHQTQVILSNGNRSTFVPSEVTESSIAGVSDVIGGLKFRLSEIDIISFGSDIEVAVAELPFHQWMLQPAIEPRFLREAGEDPAGNGIASTWVGKPAPDFHLELLDGGGFTLSEAKGKVIVLDFWASWCGPCMLTMPMMDEAMKSFDPEKVQLISVNLEERPEQVKEVLSRHKLTPKVALDIDGAVARRYQIDSIPQLIVVDAKGVVARHYIGGGQSVVDEFSAALKELLEGPASE